jgi:hypothetical protein
MNMPKQAGKILTKKEVLGLLKAVISSCQEGYDGTWDCTGEGKEGFMDMAYCLEQVRDYIKRQK